MTDKLVTISVAIYNSEKYLAECLDSLINQTYPNLEILLINDGSTDNSLQICNMYAVADRRIKVIDKENGGLTECRRLGFDIATGDYIIFPDSDDIMNPDYIEKLLTACLANNAEIAVCGYRKIGLENIEYPAVSDIDCIEKRDFPKRIMLPYISEQKNDKTVIYPYCWNHLYKKECLFNECFVSEKLTTREDCYLNLMVLDKVERIAVVPEMLYIYRTNVNSMTFLYRENRFEKDMFFYNFAEKYLSERNIDGSTQLINMIRGEITGNIDNFCKSGSYKIFRKGIKRMKSEKIVNDAGIDCIYNSQSSAIRITGILFRVNASLLLYLFRKMVLWSKGIK